MEVRDRRQNQVYIVIYDWSRDTLIRLAASGSYDTFPVWTPDGQRIVFTRIIAGESDASLSMRRADGTGDVQRLTESKKIESATSWSPNGKLLTFSEENPTTGSDVMMLPVDGDDVSGWKPGKGTPFLNSPADEGEAMFSPDGHWLAYVSDESGRDEVYVRPFPGSERKWAISSGGGNYPRWSSRRHDLFYGTPDGHIMVVSYAVDRVSFRAEKPRLWSEARFQTRVNAPFDLHPDGERFAVAELPDINQGHVTLIFNFLDEVRRVAPATKK
jgi:serine/threonine-protein kinase